MEFLENYETYQIVAGAAVLLGLAFGVVAERTGYCLRGGVQDLLETPDAPRLRGWLAGLVVALVGTQALVFGGFLDLSESIYLSSPLSLGGLVAGGLLFGAGMVLTGGCLSRLLVLSATGNMRAWIVLTVAAITGYAALRGLFAVPRIELQDATVVGVESAGLAGLAAESAGITPEVAGLVIAGLIGLPVVLWIFARRVAPRHIVGGALIGALVPAGWAATAILGADDFDPTPLASLTFTAPIADTIQYGMTFTGSTINFGIALVIGVLGGAFLSALAGGRLELQSFESPQQTLRYLAGAVMMGIGGVTALGCTIGQGLTGVSTLSIGSIITLGAIVAGAVVAMKLREGAFRRAPVLSPAE